MRVVSHEEFLEFSKGNEYYDGRWAYLEKVGAIIARENPKKVLELGPSFITIAHDCDIMYLPEIDSWGIPQRITGTAYPHDATVIPWPIQDKQYDMFVALQVFEHLDGKQRQAFGEAKRIAKSVILSLPYQWDCTNAHAGYYPSHHMINENTILEWAGGEKPIETIYIPRTGERISKGERIICYWKF